MAKHIDLGFTQLEVHDNFVISRTEEGETLTLAKHEQMMTAIHPYLDGRFYLILDEVFSYAIDLDVLFSLRDNQTVSAICIVAYRDSTRLVLESTRDIINKPVFFFESLETATLFVTHDQTEE